MREAGYAGPRHLSTPPPARAEGGVFVYLGLAPTGEHLDPAEDGSEAHTQLYDEQPGRCPDLTPLQRLGAGAGGGISTRGAGTRARTLSHEPPSTLMQ